VLAAGTKAEDATTKRKTKKECIFKRFLLLSQPESKGKSCNRSVPYLERKAANCQFYQCAPACVAY